MKGFVKRGEVYYADFDPTVGSEQGGVRPLLIIQNDVGNKYSPTTVVVPITSKVGKKSHQPTHVPVRCEGLSMNSMALLEEVTYGSHYQTIKRKLLRPCFRRQKERETGCHECNISPTGRSKQGGD